MVATSMLAALGVMLAGVAGFSFAYAWGSRKGAWAEAAGALAFDDRIKAVARLRKGCAPLKPLARKLLSVRAMHKATQDVTAVLERRFAQGGARDRVAFDEAAVLSLILASALMVGAMVGLVASSPLCGMAVCLGFGIVVFQMARSDCDKHAEAVREEVPEALRSMGVCFRSGLSLLQTLKQVAHELDGSLGKLFEVAAQRLEMGATTTEALSVMRTARQVPELSFVAVALDAQHQSGGSIGAVLDAARESVESELELHRVLRVQTTQAKLSARIVTVMPFLLVALFSVMSPGFLEPFFTGWLGMVLLASALIMDAAGIAIVHRMLKASAE